MKGREASILSMGAAALRHGQQHPDSDMGSTLSLARLQALVERGEKAAVEQREAQVNQRVATKQKRALRRAMRAGPLAHLAGVGRLAAADNIEVAQMFLAKPGARRYAAFLTMARSMYNAAMAHREVLASYGASESLLAEFGQMLDQFEAAVKLSTNGRTEHKGATLEIERVTRLIGQTVRVMDGRNHQRFQDNPQALGEWISARRVLGIPGSGGRTSEVGVAGAPGGSAAPEKETAAGDERPAA
jgi:hypothetical protein